MRTKAYVDTEIKKALANYRGSSSNVVDQQDVLAFKRIAFLGLPQEMEYDAWIEAIEQLMKQNFHRVRIQDCSVFLFPWGLRKPCYDTNWIH